MNIIEELRKPLKITDVDFRIQSINKGGYATILAYKDARVDMNRLDAVCGAHWQDDYKVLEDQLYCGIGIKIESEWIWRWDVGTESFTEKVKGRASDAFKRAGFRWGIGRELYDYPTIQVKLRSDEFTTENGKVKQTWNLKLKQWGWSVEFKGNHVAKLTAVDEKGAARYNYQAGKSGTPQQGPVQKNTSTKKEKFWLNEKNEEGDLTREWLNVVSAIGEDKITSLNQVRDHYKISEATAKEIQRIINLKLENA